MNTKKLLSFIMVLMLAINVSAESFTYFNRGIAFKCKVKDGKAVITGFDNKAAMVVIPAQVKDKRGHTLQVSAKLQIYIKLAQLCLSKASQRFLIIVSLVLQSSQKFIFQILLRKWVRKHSIQKLRQNSTCLPQSTSQTFWQVM